MAKIEKVSEVREEPVTTKRPYQTPRIETHPLFERMALDCGLGKFATPAPTSS